MEVDQVLILWDRVLGYMDVTILAVFAVSVFLFRAVPLFQCTTQAEAQLVLNEGMTLRVVPLLQMYLFSEKGESKSGPAGGASAAPSRS